MGPLLIYACVLFTESVTRMRAAGQNLQATFCRPKFAGQNLWVNIFLKVPSLHIGGSGVRPTPFLFYPHPFDKKGTIDIEYSESPSF